MAAGTALAQKARPAPEAADKTPGMALMSAVVSIDGELARGAGAVSASSIGSGQYSVVFGRSLQGCTFVATVGDPSPSVGYSDQASALGPQGTNNEQVWVQTSAVTGVTANRPFHLMVFCAK